MEQRYLPGPGVRERAIAPMSATPAMAAAISIPGAMPDTGRDGLISYAVLLWKHKVSIALLTVAGAAGAFVFAFTQPKQYRAEIAVEIQTPNENFLNLSSINPNNSTVSYADDAYVQTQADLMSQDWLVEKTLLRLKPADSFQAPKPGRMTQLKQALGMADPNAAQTPLKLAVDETKKWLNIEPGRKSRIMRISYQAEDPKFAADFVNVLATTYVSHTVEARWAAANETRDWLKPQLEELRKKLEKSERELQSYVRGSGLGLSAGRENLEEERLRLMQTEVAQAQADRIAKESRHVTEIQTPNAAPGENEVVRSYEIQLTELRKQLADMNLVLMPESQKVQRLQAQIAEVETALRTEQTRMKARIGQDLETARRRENSLTSGYGNQARVASESSARLIHYDSLKHEVEVTRSFYQGMMQKVNEAGVASAIRPSNIRITGKAEIPYVPVSPNIPLLTLMGLAGGLVAGCCLALTREIGFVPADAADAVVHPVLVPELGGGLRSKVLGTWVGDLIPPGENAAAYGLSVQRQSTGLPESYRGAAVSLLSSVVNGKKPQVIAVTSAGTLEGKTTAVCNLGIALSELGRRVLLIDGDLRGPQLKSVLGGVVETGLTTLLSGRPEIRDIPQEFLSIRTAVHNLNLLPSGGAEVHSVDLFCSQRMEDLMKRLRSLFDFVLIDAPAASIVSDTKVLGLHTDGVVLIRSGISNDEATIAAARHFSMEGLPVIGTIHNSSEYRTGTIMGNYRGLHTASSGAGVRL